ncbi:MAG TPA: ABC transporter permease [Syntrophorhabdaceae bacterium]|nr:ABC transporter permease [Syntrophorhabdaceae bacterium]
MTTYIIRRLMQGVVILLVVTMLVFGAMRFLPGDPLTLYVAQTQLETISPEQMAVLKHQFGLDKSIPVQYLDWIRGVLKGDFGTSIFYSEKVSKLLAERLPVTFYVGVFAFLLSSIVGISAGVISAVRRGRLLDTVVTVLANLGITTPGFWLGILLIYIFGFKLKLLPVVGYTSPFVDFWLSIKQLIMPVICLAVAPIASLARQTRSSMLEVIRQDYVRTAWSKGLKERIIIRRHALKNGLIPVVTLLGMQVRNIFGGAVLIETVFNIPGIGRLLVQATFGQDYQVVQAGVLVLATVVMLSNLIVDLSYGWLDPRIRYG